MKRSILPGMRISAFIGLPSAARASCSAMVKPRLGMNGKGCAGSIASGVSSGNTLWRKWSSIQVRSALVTSWPSTSTMPASASVPRRSRQIACWSEASCETVWLMQRELLGRRQAVGAALGDALADLRLDAGDADHEELVEVIGGNRQESHPLQHGMAGIDRFLEDAAVEVQPGELAIDEPLGAAWRSPAAPRPPGSFSLISIACAESIRSFDPSQFGRDLRLSADAGRSMCYADDVSMTLMFRRAPPSRRRPGRAGQASRSSSAASARVTGRPSRSASLSSSSTACRAAA